MPFPDLHFDIKDMPAALNVLAAMITPALLISASGTFILSTSNRLARVVDRMRALSERIDATATAETRKQYDLDHLDLWKSQLRRQISRLKLLQTSLTLLYVAASTFMCTSVFIGLLFAMGLRFYWIPVAMFLTGAALLLIAGILLIAETRMAVANAEDEMKLVIRIATERERLS